jgi:hypothetical protein
VDGEADVSAPDNIVLPTLEQYRAQVMCDCHWCKGSLSQTVDIYEHDSGWYVNGLDKKQWLSVKCLKCGYDWSFNKLLVARPFGKLTKLKFKERA